MTVLSLFQFVLLKNISHFYGLDLAEDPDQFVAYIISFRKMQGIVYFLAGFIILHVAFPNLNVSSLQESQPQRHEEKKRR